MSGDAERSAAAMTPLAAIGRLVAKDAILVGWRYAAIAAALYLVYGAALYLNRAVYVVAAPLVGALVAIAIAALDWNKRGEVLLASLPVSPNAVVVGRYASTAAVVAAMALLASGYGAVLGAILGGSAGGAGTAAGQLLAAVVPASSATLALMALVLPFGMRYGMGRGLLRFVMSAAALVVLLGLTQMLWPGAPWERAAAAIAEAVAAARDGQAPSVAMVAIALGAFVASTLLSTRLYRKREF